MEAVRIALRAIPILGAGHLLSSVVMMVVQAIGMHPPGNPSHSAPPRPFSHGQSKSLQTGNPQKGRLRVELLDPRAVSRFGDRACHRASLSFGAGGCFARAASRRFGRDAASVRVRDGSGTGRPGGHIWCDTIVAADRHRCCADAAAVQI